MSHREARPSSARYTDAVNRESTLRFDLDLRESLHHRLRPDALVLQEDRNLVMGPAGVLDPEIDVDMDEALHVAAAQRPVTLGRFVVAHRTEGVAPLTYGAVVHDFDSRPTCRPGDVRRSLTAIIADADRRGLATLAVEPIGVWNRHGLTMDGMVEAVDRSLLEASVSIRGNLRIVLMLDRLDQLEEVSHLLRSKVMRRGSRSFRTVNGDAAVVEVRWERYRLHVRFVPGTMSGYMVTRLSGSRDEQAHGASTCRDTS